MLHQITTNSNAANDSKIFRNRTVPIASTITAVTGYPSKLVIFKIEASRFWQVRCWIDGKTYRKSTKTRSIRMAEKFARWFYESMLAKIFLTSHKYSVETEAFHQPNIKINSVFKKELLFGAVAAQTYANEQSRVSRGELGARSLQVFKNRLDAQILPNLGTLPIVELNYQKILSFSQFLSSNHSSITVSHYLVIVRKILTHAYQSGMIPKIPEFPKLRVKSKSRGAFTPSEYWLLIKTARRLIGKHHPKSKQDLRIQHNIRHNNSVMPMDMSWAIGLMVNGFLRPGDLVKLKHRHVEIISGKNTYLRLTLPQTKLHDAPIVTLRAAVRIYRQIIARGKIQGFYSADDYLLLPHIKDRSQAMSVFNVMFNWILAHTGLKLNSHGHPRSLYSLRHSAITFRLLYGQGIDLITLARNARTSVEVINNHYASTVTGEQNIAMLQSKRGNILRS